MPRGIYHHIKCASVEHKPFIPTEHQEKTLDYFLSSSYKGLLLYHKLGSGKTCTAIIIADKMLKKKIINGVFILTPGSLRDGWVNEYCGICGKSSEYLSEKYTFITYNYMVGHNLPNFDNCLIIIDEVHNLINGVKNFSQHPTAIYDKLLVSNCRILALSGTPIFNYIYEFALLGNLLKPGGDFPEIRSGGELHVKTFMKLFQFDKKGKLINGKDMKNRLEGIVSYYPGAGSEFVPDIIEEEPIKVQMTGLQEYQYWVKEDLEYRFSHKPSKKLYRENRVLYDRALKLYIMAKKNIMTRKASNFYYPSDIGKKKDLPVEEGGWIEKELFSDGELYKIYSPKITAFLVNLVLHINQKHVLFTFFKQKSGVYLIKTILGMCGINAEIFSGDLDDKQRRALLKKFNSPNNRYGQKIKVLLVTEAGAEGISVLEARHMHILESSPRMSKTIQAIGRVARFKSHLKLPEEERNIKIWKYWSMASPDQLTVDVSFMDENGIKRTATKKITNKKTIDELLYDKGMKTIREVESFLDLLKETSVTN